MVQRRLTVRVTMSSSEEIEYTPFLQHRHRAPSSAAPFLLPSIDLPKIPTFEKSTGHLRDKLLGDVLVAFGVTLGVAPFISVADKAIVQRANGSHSITSSVASTVRSMARNPIEYFKSPMFLMMWGVYGVTYATANSLKTIMEHQEHDRKTLESRQGISHQDSSSSSNAGNMAVFTGTTVVNSAVSLLKDKAYARMFGSAGASSSMPMVTYGLWMTRDLMVVGSSFVLPELVSKKLQDEYSLKKDDALRISQVTVPLVTQLFAAPVQMLGLDYYNRPLSSLGYAEAAIERTRFLANGFWSVVGARIARIFPAYSIGGVLNTKYRDQWKDHLIQKEIQRMDQRQDTSSKQDMANRLVGLVTEKMS